MECIGIIIQIVITGIADPKWLMLAQKARAAGWTIPKFVLVQTILSRGGTTPYAPVLSIPMPCGTTVIFQTINDLPDKSVPCPCGDKEHWAVKYEVLMDTIGKN